AGLLRALAERLPDGRGLLRLLAILLIEARRRRERPLGVVVDELRVDVRERAVHRKARTRRAAAHLLAHALVTATTTLLASLLCHLCPCLRADLAGLARLLAEPLLGVLHALVLVRVRVPQTPDLRRDLADELLIRTRDFELLWRLRRERDARRRLDLDRVAVPEVERHLLALDDRAVAGAVDLEVAAVAGRDAGDHVRDERSREPVEGARRLLVVLAGDQDRAVLALER